MGKDSDTSIPLYAQVANQLRFDIEHGKYAKGERIPTEKELGQLYAVSRITVRSALDELEKEHLLIRKQGKGTFIAREKFRRDISRGSSFTQICLANGQIPGAKVIKSVIENADESDLAELKLPEKSKVIVIERIRYADDIPVALEISRLPERFAFLLNENLNDASLISLLLEKYNISFTCTTKVLELVYASYEIARYLSVADCYPLISIYSLSCDTEGTPAHRSLQYVVGDKFKFFL